MHQTPSHTAPPPNSQAAAYGYKPAGSMASHGVSWSHTVTEHKHSSSWITDGIGNVNQYLAYLPFGEQFIDQRKTGHDIRFKFTGKEKDSETGYTYFGVRYYSSDLSVWLSVDPLADKYPSMSPYMYVRGNPVMFIDRWGLEGEPNKYEKRYARKKARFHRTGAARHGRQLTRYINRKGSKIGRSNATYHEGSNYVGFDVGKSNSTVSFRKGKGPNNGGTNVSGPVFMAGAVYGGGSAGGGDDVANTANTVASAVSYIIGVIGNTLNSTRIGSNIAYSLLNSKAFLTSVKYLRPIGYWASGIGVGTDVIMSLEGSQTWTESGINTAVTGIAIGVGGWSGLIIQGNYQASKAYMNTISKHPEWVLPSGYHSFYH